MGVPPGPCRLGVTRETLKAHEMLTKIEKAIHQPLVLFRLLFAQSATLSRPGEILDLK